MNLIPGIGFFFFFLSNQRTKQVAVERKRKSLWLNRFLKAPWCFVCKTSTSDRQDILLSHSARHQTRVTTRLSPDSSQSLCHKESLKWQCNVIQLWLQSNRIYNSWCLFARGWISRSMGLIALKLQKIPVNWHANLSLTGQNFLSCILKSTHLVLQGFTWWIICMTPTGWMCSAAQGPVKPVKKLPGGKIRLAKEISHLLNEQAEPLSPWQTWFALLFSA